MSSPAHLVTKLSVCLAMLLICLVVVGGVNAVSFQEYFFSHPPKRDVTTRLPVRSLPAFSAIYFPWYRYSWALMLVALPWSIVLVVRNKTTLEHLAVFAACMMLGCVFVATCALIAIYICNQTFLARFQHLQYPVT